MILKRNFYNSHTVKVAEDLLGCFLVRKYRGKIIRTRIIETEAYRGEYDLACHASKGKTARTEIMYGRAGHAYVYMIYGMYFMLNIVTEERDFPAAVLVRGVEIIPELSSRNFRELSSGRQVDGPGKLTKFLHIDKSLNSWDLTVGEKLWIEQSKSNEKFKLKKSPRVGIDYARHCRHWKWNFRTDEN